MWTHLGVIELRGAEGHLTTYKAVELGDDERVLGSTLAATRDHLYLVGSRSNAAADIRVQAIDAITPGIDAVFQDTIGGEEEGQGALRYPRAEPLVRFTRNATVMVVIGGSSPGVEFVPIVEALDIESYGPEGHGHFQIVVDLGIQSPVPNKVLYSLLSDREHEFILCQSTVASDGEIVSTFSHIDVGGGRSAPLPRYGRHLSNITDHICLPKYHESQQTGSYIEAPSSYFWSLQRL